MFLTSYCRIRNQTVTVNGAQLFALPASSFEDFAAALYQSTGIGYPKFYKMDNQSKLGLLAAEVLLQNQPFLQKYAGESVHVVLSNAVASQEADEKYFETIADPAAYFPSPALFVYTLPSIVTGEICIRHKFQGENAFFITEEFNAGLLYGYLANLMQHSSTSACLGGWINYQLPEYEAFLFTIEATPVAYKAPLNPSILQHLYTNDAWIH